MEPSGSSRVVVDPYFSVNRIVRIKSPIHVAVCARNAAFKVYLSINSVELKRASDFEGGVWV